MMGLYSNVDVDKPKRAIRNIEYVMIKIAVQTIECGIFIHQYTFNMGEWRYFILRRPNV